MWEEEEEEEEGGEGASVAVVVGGGGGAQIKNRGRFVDSNSKLLRRSFAALALRPQRAAVCVCVCVCVYVSARLFGYVCPWQRVCLFESKHEVVRLLPRNAW